MWLNNLCLQVLINIEKDQSNSIIIAATNLPESLDKALFRRFDEIIEYPLPDENHIVEIIKKHTKSFSFPSKVDYKALSKLALGLNYSEIVRICNDTIKEMILNDSVKLELETLKKLLILRNVVNEKQATCFI